MAPPKKNSPPKKKKDCDCEKEGQTFSPEQNAARPRARQLPDGTLVAGGAEPQDAFYRAKMGPDGYLQAGGAEPQDAFNRVRTDPDGTMRTGGAQPFAEPGWLEQAYDTIFGSDEPQNQPPAPAPEPEPDPDRPFRGRYPDEDANFPWGEPTDEEKVKGLEDKPWWYRSMDEERRLRKLRKEDVPWWLKLSGE
jgi:hypothetical protein